MAGGNAERMVYVAEFSFNRLQQCRFATAALSPQDYVPPSPEFHRQQLRQ
jgi:hypothetical protein